MYLTTSRSIVILAQFVIRLLDLLRVLFLHLLVALPLGLAARPGRKNQSKTYT